MIKSMKRLKEVFQINKRSTNEVAYVFHNIAGDYYLTDDGSHGPVVLFNSRPEGKQALKEANGGKLPRRVKYLRSIGKCVKCGAPLFKSEVKGYTYQCFGCDEDFFKYEQKR